MRFHGDFMGIPTIWKLGYPMARWLYFGCIYMMDFLMFYSYLLIYWGSVIERMPGPIIMEVIASGSPLKGWKFYPMHCQFLNFVRRPICQAYFLGIPFFKVQTLWTRRWFWDGHPNSSWHPWTTHQALNPINPFSFPKAPHAQSISKPNYFPAILFLSLRRSFSTSHSWHMYFLCFPIQKPFMFWELVGGWATRKIWVRQLGW